MSEIVYSWNFNPLEVVYNEDSLVNVVNVVHWQLSATHTSSSLMVQNIGTVALEPPTSGLFIPFNELTEEVVSGWVESKLGEDVITNMRTSLSSSISERLNPVKGTVLPPWETLPTP